MKNNFKETLFIALFLSFLACDTAQAQIFATNRAFNAHDPMRAEQFGLPRKIQILSIELYRDNIFDNLRSRIIYKINEEKLQSESLAELQSTQGNGSYIVRSFLFSTGNYGAGCGPHNLTRAYVNFLLSADASQMSGQTFYAINETTQDNCHTPMQTEQLDYSVDE